MKKSVKNVVVSGLALVSMAAPALMTANTVFAADSTTAATTTKKVSATVGTVHYVKGYGIQVYHDDGKKVLNANGSAKKLMDGSKWKTFGTMFIAGQEMYNLGGDQYAATGYIELASATKTPAVKAATPTTTNDFVAVAGVATVNYIKGYGIQVYHADGSKVYTSTGKLKKLMSRTSWKTFGMQTVAGQTMIKVGGDQFVPGRYLVINNGYADQQ